MASLEAQINQYTTEIKDKEAEIKDLWTQKMQLEDADKKKEIEQRIQALQDDKAELVKLRRTSCRVRLDVVYVISIHTQSHHTRCFLHLSRLFAQSAWRTAVTAVAAR